MRYLKMVFNWGGFVVRCVVPLLAGWLAIGCGRGPTGDVEGPVVVYSGRSEALVGEVIAQAATALKIDVQVQYGDTADLVSRLLVEGAESPADLIFAQDSGYLGVLSQRAALQPLDAATLDPVDPRFRDAAGRWIGTSGRLRTLVVDTQVVDTPPQSLADLADPRWRGQVAWAPTNSSFQAHVSGLRHAWGEDATRAWLVAVRDNAPQAFPKNAALVDAVNSGGAAIGWTNHYYLHRTDPSGRRAANRPLPEAGRDGNVMMVSGVGVRAGSPRSADAERLAAWLVSEPAQRHFTHANFEYPARAGVPTHPDVAPLADIPLSPITQEHLADLGPTLAMLEALGLL